MEDNAIRMVITDLDGTLLNDSGEIGIRDIRTLEWLGREGIYRVIATGRNLFSAKKALGNIPFDYLIFSTGAGIIEWQTAELVYASQLDEHEVGLAVRTLKNAGMSFMVHHLVPDNHEFLYFDAMCGNSDFQRRCELYKDFAAPMDPEFHEFKHASQLLAIIDEDLEILEKIRTSLSPLRVIRTTSPLDGETMWIEIFPPDVSKGHASEWLCRRLGIERTATAGIGNDYNDIDLLDFVKHPFAVENAPEQLRSKYINCRSNNDNGFSDAVSRVLGIIN